MNIAQIEENIKALITSLSSGECTQEDFIYELLLTYGHRKQSVTRLRSGERNLSSRGSEPMHDAIIWKRNLYFKHIEGNALHAEIDQMRKEKLVASNKIRFVIVTNFYQLLAVDTKTSGSLEINLDELHKQFDFFLPWAGMEKAVYKGENPADVKAAEKMAKLFDLIKADNFDESNRDDTEALHGLNVFLTRLLFCFFAEDTEIFADNQFSNAIQSHTKDDGSDLSDYMNRLFTVLNTSGNDRGELPDYLSDFPYVNGGLFATDIPSPLFTAKSRRMLIECGSELDWSDINPDIFGSMIQAVVHPDQRGGMGMHYTSVTNIMKVIEPLFLNDLYEDLERSESSAIKLQKLQQRLGEIKIFDPACGSGNFLIIAYKELRKFEMEVLKRIQEIELEKTGQIDQPFSVIKLSQFYGIELDDFAHEVAILSLWLAEHQMNVEFKAEFGECSPALPLQKSGGIVCGNAALTCWNEVCENIGEVYVLGNPPYLGSKVQLKHHKDDMKHVFEGLKNFKDLDYIACWFYKAGKYIRNHDQKAAFVTTNSICQGGQVAMLWPHVFDMGLEISFCHKSFKWSNSAKKNAGVICSIIGLSKSTSNAKNLYYESYSREVNNINSYLLPSKNVFVSRRSKPLSDLPKMDLGNMPIDGGNLILSTEEKNHMVGEFPESLSLFKKLYGSKEFIRGQVRWCLWIENADLVLANSIPPICKRIENVRRLRLESVDAGTNKLAAKPHQFREMKSAKNSLLLISRVSSERREYIPIGFLGSDSVVADAQVIYDAELYIFGLLSSKLHTAWVKVVAGRLKTDFRYSSAICWNNFPVPDLSEQDKSSISDAVTKVLMARESFPDKTIAKLYDPGKMPDELKSAHASLDICVEAAYGCKPFKDDDDRVEFLFGEYLKMTGGQNA
jgi:hypothetical protein